MAKGFVYLVAEAEEGPVKIGRSSDYWKRLKEIQIGNPRPLRLKALLYTRECEVIEAQVHDRLGRRRIRGEWFDVSVPAAIVAMQRTIKARRRMGLAWDAPSLDDLVTMDVAVSGGRVVGPVADAA